MEQIIQQNIEQIIERLPKLMGRAINGDKRMEVRIQKSGRERGGSARKVRSIIRVQDDETHDHDADGHHEHGDKDDDDDEGSMFLLRKGIARVFVRPPASALRPEAIASI